MRLANSMTISESVMNTADYPRTEPNFFEPLWYAVYTNANHEKQVTQQLELRSIEHLLPLYESVRRWKDRRVRLQMPLFPGYVFVRLVLRDRLQLLQIPGIVRLVSFNGRPAALPDEDVQAIQNCLGHGCHVEPHPYMQAGRRVRVKNGPFRGLDGIILRRKNKTRFVLSFELIMRSVAVEIDETDVIPVG